MKIVLSLALLCVAAPVAPTHAQVGPASSLTSSSPSHLAVVAVGAVRSPAPAAGVSSQSSTRVTDSTNAAPEHGTMAIASLGLLALGMALRRRKRN